MGTFGAGHYHSLCREDHWDVCGGDDAYDSGKGIFDAWSFDEY